MKKKQDQVNFITMLLAGAFIIVVAVFFTSFKRIAMTPPSQNGPMPVESSTDLENLNRELDNYNLDEMDTDFNELNKDSSTF